MVVKEIFTTGQVARVCGVSPDTVVAWIEDKILPCFRLPRGRDRRVTREDLEAFLEEQGMPTVVLHRMDGENEVEHATA